MASIKVKFRPSTLSNKEGTVYYQIIHRRTIRQLKTPYQLFAQEWDPKAGKAIITANIRHNLLPIIKPTGADERKQYQNATYLINRKLKDIGRMVGLDIPLTMYVARHSWASAAKHKNVPISVICEGMGHDSETTTQIYLASLDTTVIDKANAMILRDL